MRFPYSSIYKIRQNKNIHLTVNYSPTASHQALPESKFSENIYHSFHWGVVSDRERAQVENAPQFQRVGTVGWQLWGVFGEVHDGVAHHPILTLSRILCATQKLV